MPITIHQEKQPNVDSNDEPQEQQSAGETANDEGQHQDGIFDQQQ